MSKRMGLALGILGSVLMASAAVAQAHPGGGGGGHGGGGHFGGGGHAAAPHAVGGAHFAPAAHYAGGGVHTYAGGGVHTYAAASRGYGAYGGAVHGSTYAGHAYYGGYHGGWGGYHGYSTGAYWRGGYWRGGWWPRAYYGAGYAWFLPVLPLAYATYWYSGVPYYYANDVYYTWSPDYSGYVATDPPPVVDQSGAAAAPDAPVAGAGAQPQAAPQAAPAAPFQDPAAGQQGRMFMYPKNGQTEEQQSTDRRECQQWAAQQAGATNSSDYQRAMAACIEGRGYSVN